MQMPWDIDVDVYKNEAELLEGLRKNEREACTCMFKRFAQRLFVLARRLIPNTTEAEDVLQESFIQACNHVSTFEGKSSLATWLHRIVTNMALMKIRKKSSETLSLTPDEAEPEQESALKALIDTEHMPDQEMLQTEVRIAIRKAILQLPESLRTAFLLRHVEGLSTREAAAALGITESSLKVRLYRARQQLQNLLVPYK